MSITEIIPYLYVGNIGIACDTQILKKYNIIHLIQLIPETIVQASRILLPQDGTEKLNECCDFMETCIQKKENILIYCYSGSVKSAIVTSYFLSRKLEISVYDAYLFCKIKRKIFNLSIDILDSMALGPNIINGPAEEIYNLLPKVVSSMEVEHESYSF